MTVAPRYSWTQAMCDPCWTVQRPDHEPLRMAVAARQVEKCAWCGHDTEAGIYVREDPATVRFPRLKEADRA